jgi:type I restriction enzyme S subunit
MISKMKKLCLGDICEKGSSNLAQKDLASNNGYYPVFGAGGLIKNIGFYQQQNEYIAIVKDGAGIGRVMILPEKSSVISTMQYIFPKPGVDIKYLYYALIFMNLSKYFSGSTIPHIYFRDYQKETIYLPPFDEQRKIASKLDKISSLLILRNQQKNRYELLVKSQFIEMFGDELNDNAVELKDVCSIITDGTHQPPKFTGSGIPFLFVSNIIGNEISYQTNKFITRKDYNVLINRTPIEVGDILLTTVGSYGNPAIVQSKQEFCFQRHIAYMKPKRNIVNSVYLHTAILSNSVKKQIETKVKGIAQKTLNLSELKTTRVNLPPIALQNEFAAFVEQADKSKFVMQKGLEKLELGYKAFMQRYFGQEP